MSTAFGCTYEGAVSADKVVRLAEQLREAGCDEVGLSDSVGYANPAQIRELVVRVRNAVGREAFAGLHLHNTRGLGLANVVAGLEVGVDTFDSSMAGIGGCPFAPGATGNIVTEDLVFMLESMGTAHWRRSSRSSSKPARSWPQPCPQKNCTVICRRPAFLSAITRERPERADGMAVLARSSDGAAMLAAAVHRNRRARRLCIRRAATDPGRCS